jgi:hypothetical protein
MSEVQFIEKTLEYNRELEAEQMPMSEFEDLPEAVFAILLDAYIKAPKKAKKKIIQFGYELKFIIEGLEAVAA